MFVYIKKKNLAGVARGCCHFILVSLCLFLHTSNIWWSRASICICVYERRRGSNGRQENCFFLNYEVKRKKDKSRIRNTPKAIFLSNLILFLFFFVQLFFFLILSLFLYVSVSDFLGGVNSRSISLRIPKNLKMWQRNVFIRFKHYQNPFPVKKKKCDYFLNIYLFLSFILFITSIFINIFCLFHNFIFFPILFH